jgi:hypothetical protein
MKTTLMNTTACLLLCATSASALDFTGGTVGFEYTAFPDISEISETGFSSSVEFAVNPALSFALDVKSSSMDIDGAPINYSTSSTFIHAIYGVNEAVNVGAYLGRSSIFYFDSNSFGVEASYDGGAYDVSGYVGIADFPMASSNMTTAGIQGGYEFGNGFGLGASFDLIDLQDEDFQGITSTIGADYSFGNGAAVFIEAGQFKRTNGSDSDTEPFVTVGTTFSFGPQGGTSFEPPKGLEMFNFGIGS